MLKKKKINSILSNTIANELIGSLSKSDFKYKKSKIQFIRHWGEYEQIIDLDSVSNPLIQDEETFDLHFGLPHYSGHRRKLIRQHYYFV